MKFGSVLSTMSLSVYAEMSTFANECASESDSKIISVMSWFVRFLLIAIMLRHFNPTWHTPNPTPADAAIQM